MELKENKKLQISKNVDPTLAILYQNTGSPSCKSCLNFFAAKEKGRKAIPSFNKQEKKSILPGLTRECFDVCIS